MRKLAKLISATMLPAAAAIALSAGAKSLPCPEAADAPTELMLESILRAVPTGVGLVHNRKLTMVNDYVLELTGYTRSELIGKSALMLYPSDIEYSYVGKEKYRQIAETGTGTVETVWKTKNGQLKPVLMSSTPLDINDLSIGVTFTVLDISDIKEAEIRFSAAFESNPAPLVISDIETGEFLAVNQAWCDMLGYSKEEHSGASSYSLGIWESTEQRSKALEIFKASGFLKELPVKFLSKCGKIKHGAWSAEAIPMYGREVLLSLIQDETYRVEAQQAMLKRSIVFISGLAVLMAFLLFLVMRLWKLNKLWKTDAENLRSSRAMLNAVLDTVPHAIFWKDHAGRYSGCNKLFLEITGIGPGEIIGRTDFDMPWKDFAQSYITDDRQVMAQRKSKLGIIEKIQIDSGSVRLIETSKAPLIGKDGEPEGVIGTFADVTQKMKTEEDAAYRQSILDSLLANLPIGVFMVESGSGKPIIANPKAKELLGRGILPDVNDKNISEVYKAITSGTREKYPTGKMPIILGMHGKKSYIDDMVVIRPDGSEVLLEVFGTPVPDASGKLIASIAIFVDISERKRQEKILRESKERLSALFRSMNELVAEFEIIYGQDKEAADYRLTHCNQAYADAAGQEISALVGGLASKSIGNPEPSMLKAYTQVAETGLVFEHEHYYAPSDRYFSMSVVSPCRGKFAVVMSDISVVKRILEDLEIKNKELESYLYIASHDLRSPLVNIRGFSGRLSRSAETISKLVADAAFKSGGLAEQAADISNSEIPRSLDFINANAEKIDSIITGLLQVSRTGRLTIQPENINTVKLIGEVVKSCQLELVEAGAAIDYSGLDNCYGDAALLNQLFSNLILNAIKYRSPDRPLAIKISSERKYGKIAYCVEDNGVGMEHQELDKIWDLFYRTSCNSNTQGQGIGLSIVKRIAEKHKGKVWASSSPGLGSKFFIELYRHDIPKYS
jgi:PAS domain S-box-containing protein